MAQGNKKVKKSADELYDARQYWWWAEKKRSPRLNYLRKAVWSKATKGSACLPEFRGPGKYPLVHEDIQGGASRGTVYYHEGKGACRSPR